MSELTLPESKAHDLFYIPELLEAILLNLDTHTLLISARVCYMRNDLIKSSRKIQQALFYIPCNAVDPDQPSIMTPLVAGRIWRDIICARLSRTIPEYFIYTPDIPQLSREREQAYLRPEASWRRMLLQQAPNSTVIFEGFLPGYSYYKCPSLCPEDATWASRGEYIRTEHMVHWANIGIFMPKLLFYLDLGPLWIDRCRKLELTKEARLTQDIARFDLTVSSEIPCGLSPDTTNEPWMIEWCIGRGGVVLYPWPS